MNIPPIFPDEHPLGWRGRIRFFNHHPNSKETIEALKVDLTRRQLLADEVYGSTPQLLILGRASGKPLSDFAYLHSFFPIVKAFGPHRPQDINDTRRGNPAIRFGATSGKDGAWFCCACADEDRHLHGMPYWRRSHHLVGVDWCYEHAEKLRGVYSRDAFDYFPPIHNLTESVVPDGPDLFSDADPIVQRYVLIVKALLERREPLDLQRTVSVLRRQFLAVTSLYSRYGSNSDIDIEGSFPLHWRLRFSDPRTRSQGNDVFNFQKLLNQTHVPLDTERYVIAFSFLFQTEKAALHNLEFSQREDADSTNFTVQKKDFWWSEAVLSRYVAHQGGHNAFSSELGLERALVSNALLEHGLPDLSSVPKKHRLAIQDFFDGTSLSDSCASHGVDIREIEALLRISGRRAANGLRRIGGAI